MLTGSPSFSVTDPMELVHCHIARQPVAPVERRNGIPGPVSAIVMKLLNKTAEERYQTATGAASGAVGILSVIAAIPSPWRRSAVTRM